MNINESDAMKQAETIKKIVEESMAEARVRVAMMRAAAERRIEEDRRRKREEALKGRSWLYRKLYWLWEPR